MTNAKSKRGRTADGQPNPIDIHIGNRIRLRRQLLGLSQEKLAAALGLTFQQVQKYERGMNRIGGSRLWDVSKALDASIQFFYDDMDDATAAQSPAALNTGTATAAENSGDPLQRKESLELVKNFYRIPNRKSAKLLSELAQEMAKSYYREEIADE